MGPSAVISKRAAKRAARALGAQQGADGKASPSRTTLPPLKMPPPGTRVRISPQPLSRYAFFTPSSPLICSWTQPHPSEHIFGPGVARCERILGYNFKSKILLAEALNIEQNSSPGGQFKLGTAQYFLPTNKRFALYGDSLARTYLARKWLELGPNANGALWNATSHKVLSDQGFGAIFLRLGLGDCVAYATMAPKEGKAVDPDKTPKFMATTVEAIVAAAFLDGGEAALEVVMGRFGMDQHFVDEPAVYDFFRHGQPSGDLPSSSTPSEVPEAQ